MKPTELATYLALSHQQVRALLRKGKIKSTKKQTFTREGREFGFEYEITPDEAQRIQQERTNAK